MRRLPRAGLVGARVVGALWLLARAAGQAAGIVAIVFFLVRVIPGDAVDLMSLQGDLSQQQAEQVRQELGLDRSVPSQFLAWAGHALRGDFGTSIRFGRPVAEMLRSAYPTTLLLASASFLLAVVLAVGIAMLAVASGRRSWAGVVGARAVGALNVVAIALPSFCVGVVGILVFSVWLGWLPVLGSLVLPVAILGIDKAGQMVKTVFEELQEATTSAHVRTARARGLGPVRIALFHLLPAALPVTFALSGLVLASLVAGSLTMEVLFGLNGIGSLTLNAILGRDYPVIQAAITVVAVAIVAVNAAMDLLNRLVDPRIAA